MRDRPTEGTFFFASLDVDMNPLMVAGHVGELIYFLLGDVNRLAPRTKLFADLRGERRHIVKFDYLHRRCSPMFRLPEPCQVLADSGFIMQLSDARLCDVRCRWRFSLRSLVEGVRNFYRARTQCHVIRSAGHSK